MTGDDRPPIVVKLGGQQRMDRSRTCDDLARLVHAGQRLVVVHGGSGDIAELAGRLGVPNRVLTSPTGFTNRHTTADMLAVVTMALAGRVKPDLVGRLVAGGVAAVGLTGIDAGLVVARRKRGRRAVVDGRVVAVHDDRSGRIDRVRPALLRHLLGGGYTPVLSPPALDGEGGALNVDADRFAAAVAAALGAQRLVYLTGAPGVLADARDERSVMPTVALPAAGTERLPGEGGMKLKLLAAREALLHGVPVRIAGGYADSPVRQALDGAGTEVVLARQPQAARS